MKNFTLSIRMLMVALSVLLSSTIPGIIFAAMTPPLGAVSTFGILSHTFTYANNGSTI